MVQVKFVEDSLEKISLGPFLNTSSHLFMTISLAFWSQEKHNSLELISWKMIALNVVHWGCKYSFRSNRPEVSCTKGVLTNFTKFSGKHQCRSLFFSLLKKDCCLGVFKWILWNFKNTYFEEHLRTAASVRSKVRVQLKYFAIAIIRKRHRMKSRLTLSSKFWKINYFGSSSHRFIKKEKSVSCV